MKGLAEKTYSGQFRVRISAEVHRALALQAAEQGISLNRLASAKLSSLWLRRAARGKRQKSGGDVQVNTVQYLGISEAGADGLCEDS